jgi:hypothetical protein
MTARPLRGGPSRLVDARFARRLVLINGLIPLILLM